MRDDHDHDHGNGCGDAHDDEGCEPMAIEFETAGQVLLEMRAQNLEMIKIAARVAGYGGDHSPLKPNELRQAMSAIWDVYSQLYQWIDPEDALEDEEEDEEE